MARASVLFYALKGKIEKYIFLFLGAGEVRRFLKLHFPNSIVLFQLPPCLIHLLWPLLAKAFSVSVFLPTCLGPEQPEQENPLLDTCTLENCQNFCTRKSSPMQWTAELNGRTSQQDSLNLTHHGWRTWLYLFIFISPPTIMTLVSYKRVKFQHNVNYVYNHQPRQNHKYSSI